MLEIISEENLQKLKGEKVALLDLEGTLTHVKRKVPKNADPGHMEKILKGENLEGEVEIGYWTGIHLLAGETPEDYYERMKKWEKGETSVDEFENENLQQWNSLIEESDFETAEEFLEWYNERFLNLRSKAQDLIENLQEKGYIIGIISHTSTSLSIHAAEKLEADFVVPTWNFNFEEERFARAGMTKYAEEKSHILPELEDEDVEKVIFYGNGNNDTKIAEKVSKGFLVDNKQEVNYSSKECFTGSFEEVVEKTEEVIK